MDWERLIGKKVFFILRSDHHYTGEVKDVGNGLVSIIDKFGEAVSFSKDEVKLVKEV